MLFIKLKLLLKTGASSLSRRLSLQDMERNAFSFKPRHLPFPVHRLFKAKNGALLLFCRGAFPFPYTDSSRQRTERFCFFAEAPSLSRTQTLQGKERSAFAFLPRRSVLCLEESLKLTTLQSTPDRDKAWLVNKI